MRRTLFQRVLRDGHPRVVLVCRACRQRLRTYRPSSDERERGLVTTCGCDRRAA